MSDEDHEDSDPVEKMLKQAGCLELHYKIQVKNFTSPDFSWSNNFDKNSKIWP